MADVSVTFYGFGGGSRTAAVEQGVLVSAEIGGRLLREWLESRIEERDPVGWGSPFVKPVSFQLGSIDGLRDGGFASPALIDDDGLYLVQVNDSNRDPQAATGEERWVPSLLAISAALTP